MKIHFDIIIVFKQTIQVDYKQKQSHIFGRVYVMGIKFDISSVQKNENRGVAGVVVVGVVFRYGTIIVE